MSWVASVQAVCSKSFGDFVNSDAEDKVIQLCDCVMIDLTDV